MDKKNLFISLFIFFFFLSSFLYYEQPGILQLDLVGMATYAEYVIIGEKLVASPLDLAPYEHGVIPWRTGNQLLTAAAFFILSQTAILPTPPSAEHAVFLTQFIFGSLGIVFLYLFLFQLYKKYIPALFGALIFGASAPLFNAILSKDHGTEFFFAFGSFYFLSIALEKNKVIYFFLTSLFLGLLLWMREAGLFFPILLYGFFIVQTIIVTYNSQERKVIYNKEIVTLKNISLLFLPYFVLACLAFYVYVFALLKNATTDLNAAFFTYTAEMVSTISDWHPLLYFLFVFLGLYFGIIKKEKSILFFGLITLFFFVLFTKNATFDLRHLGIYVFFPASVIICYGLCCLERKWMQIAVFFLAGVLCVQLFMPGISLFEQRKEQIYTKEFGLGIASVVPSDGIVFAQKDFCLFVAYYAKRTCQGMPTSLDTFDSALASGKRVFVFYEAGFGFYDDTMKNAIEEKYVLASVYSGKFETFHHADLDPQIYDEQLIEIKVK